LPFLLPMRANLITKEFNLLEIGTGCRQLSKTLAGWLRLLLLL